MNNFDFSMYDNEDNENVSIKPNETAKKTSSDFDFSSYDNQESPVNMSEEQEQKEFFNKIKKNIRPYRPLREEGFSKGLLKGATANFSESIPGLEKYSKISEEEEKGAMHGELVGAFLPISAVSKVLTAPFQILKGLTKFGKAGQTAISIAQHAATGAGYGSLKQGAEVSKGNEFDVEKVAEEAMTFGVFGALFEAVPLAYRWAKSLNPQQKSEVFVKNIIPENLSPSQYEFYEKEVVPQLQKGAENEYKSALETATKENDLKFEKKMKQIQAEHEADLFDPKTNRQLSPEEYANKQKEFQNEIRRVQEEASKGFSRN